MSDYTALKSVSLFSKLEDKYLKTIFKATTSRTFESGEALVEQGSTGVGLFIILSGNVDIIKKTDSGEELHIASHGPGDVVGEFSVLDGAPRSAQVVASSESECLLLSSWSFQGILESHPEVARGILPMVVKRFRETNAALMECLDR